MPGRQELTLDSRVLIIERELDRLEAQVSANSEIKESVAVLRTEFQGLTSEFHTFAKDTHEDLVDMRTDIGGLRKTVIGAAVTVMIAAVGFALTSLAVFGAP